MLLFVMFARFEPLDSAETVPANSNVALLLTAAVTPVPMVAAPEVRPNRSLPVPPTDKAVALPRLIEPVIAVVPLPETLICLPEASFKGPAIVKTPPESCSMFKPLASVIGAEIVGAPLP